ncbi:response regulator [Methyloversatilis sp.]|uniref:hybrid sensor histidine kinase/response regulator n=1 Tax=Methyloversatilis sp. TaxID=2569862 RepID=UPI003F72938F
MRLRVLLTGCVVAALGIVGLRALSLADDAREGASLNRQGAAMEVIARDAAGLLVLTQDYLLHASPRAVRQWNAVQRELDEAMKDYAAVGALQKDEVETLIEVAANLPPLFDGLQQLQTAQPGAATDARRETLSDQLLNETRRISDGAFEVLHKVTERRGAARQRQRNQALAAQGAMLALTLALAWVLLRRVLRPLALLQRGAQAVQGGDLGRRIDYRGRDELGRLSQAFDAMTTALQERAAALQASNERLARSEAFQERAGRIAGVGGWELEIAAGKLTWSAQTRTIHEVAPDFQPNLDNAISFYDPAVRPVLQQAIARAVADGTPWDLELPFTTALGNARWVRATGTAEFSEGRAVRLVGAFQDATARRAADEALRVATQQAQAANEAKTSFLANMSHEIRTPMNAVIGLSYLMQQTSLDAEQQALLGKINSAGRALMEVINDVLDLSKIEAGEMEIEQVVFDPRSLIDELTGVFGPQAAQRGIGVHTVLAAALPQRLRGDATRLRQILTNLLSNALKFTPQGEVRLTVTVDAADADTDPLRLRFTVQDTGMGMSPQVQERLFTPFVQADASTTRRFGGTGLGLSIVKRLVTMQGGEITVQSAPGEGSRFEVTLPFETAGADAEDLPGPRPVEVLVAEDDAKQREALLALCRRLGWRTEAVGDGPALIERVRERRRQGLPPEALVVDWRLPGLDGLQALAALHEDAVAGKEPAVVMVSAEGRDALARAPHVGLADELLGKPIEASALFNAVYAAVARRSGDGTRVLLASALEAAGVARLPGVRVLVVDDSDINREVAQRILVREGAEVLLAHDGAEAVAMLRARQDSAGMVDIVLMDVQMPVLDGLAAARQIRGELGLKQLPLVALTAGALLSERQRALDAGMDGFVSKPFEPQALVGLLHRLVEQARGGPLPLAPRAAAAGQAAEPAARADWPTIEGIDSAEVCRRLEGDLRLFTRLLDRLHDEFSDLAQPTPPLREPMAQAALAARLHKLAGSAGLLGAHRLRQAAMVADDAARHAAAPDALAQAVADVALALQQLFDASANWRTAARQQREVQTQAAVPAVALPCDDAAFVLWRAQLQANDLNALAQFEHLAPALRATLGRDRFDVVEAALGRLAFDQVLLLLGEDGAVPEQEGPRPAG